MSLFEECINSLGKNTQILSLQDTEFYFDELVKKFPVTSWARIDWDKISKKEEWRKFLFYCHKFIKRHKFANQILLIINSIIYEKLKRFFQNIDVGSLFDFFNLPNRQIIDYLTEQIFISF